MSPKEFQIFDVAQETVSGRYVPAPRGVGGVGVNAQEPSFFGGGVSCFSASGLVNR